jgi:hypothetical protein
MEWLVVLTLTFNGKTGQVPWALTHDATSCNITGAAVVMLMERVTPGLDAAFTCVQRVAA